MQSKAIQVNFISDHPDHCHHLKTLLDQVEIGEFMLSFSESLDVARADMLNNHCDVYLLECERMTPKALELLHYARELPHPAHIIIVAHEKDLAGEQRAMAAGAAGWLEFAELMPRHLRRAIYQAVYQWQTVRMLTQVHQELMETQRDLVAERDLLRAVIDYSPDYIFAKDTDLRFMVSNVAHADSVQQPPQALRGKRASEFFPEALAVQYEADDQAIIDTGEALVNALRVTQDAEGTPRHVLTTKVPLRDDMTGEVRGLVGISRDVTKRVQIEAQLRASEELHRTIVDTLQEGIIVLDASGAVETYNQAALDILGLAAAQMEGREAVDPDWHTIQEDGKPFAHEDHPTTRTLRTGEGVHGVVIGIPKPDGDTTWISVNSQPIFNAGELTGAVGSFTDLTHLLKAQAHAREAAVNEERVRLIADFLYSASHEFRTPLSIIQTSLHLLERNTEPAQRQRHMHKAHDAIERINRLVNTLLLLARLDAVTDLQRQPLSVSMLLQQAVQHWDQRFERDGVTIQMGLTPDLPRIQGHATYLMEAFGQIVENALMHTPRNGLITLRTYVDQNNNRVIAEIADSGAGIAEDDLPKVLQRFWRHDRSHTTPGFGLGLPIAHKVVELHGGALTIESAPGNGTCVTVQLPID